MTKRSGPSPISPGPGAIGGVAPNTPLQYPGGQMTIPGSQLIMHFDASREDTVDYNPRSSVVYGWDNLASLGGTAAPVDALSTPKYQKAQGRLLAGLRYENAGRTTNFQGLNMGSTYPFSSGTGAEDGLCVFCVCTPFVAKGIGPSFAIDFGNFAQAGWGLGARPGEISGYTPSLYGAVSQRISSELAREGQPIVLLLRVDFTSIWQIWANGTKLYEDNTGVFFTAMDSVQIDEASTHSLNAGPFTMGRPSESMVATDAGQCFNGLIHEVKVYNESLTEAQAIDAMRQLQAKWGAYTPETDSDLQLYLDMRHEPSITMVTKTTTATISTTAGSAAVTGSGTSFTTEIAVGDFIEINTGSSDAEKRQVYSIASTTSLTLAEVALQTTSGVAYQIYSPSVSSVAAVTGSSFTQGTAAYQPQYYPTQGATQNMLYFDGSNDFLTSSGAASTWKFLHDGTSWTIMFYARLWNDNTYNPMLSTLAADYLSPGLLIASGTAQASIKQSISDVIIGSPLTAVAGNTANFEITYEQLHLHTIDFEYSGGQATMRRYVDGHLVATDTRAATPSTGNPAHTLEIGAFDSTGGSNYAKMQFGQMLVWNTKLSDQRRQLWETWMFRRNDHEPFDNPRHETTGLVGWYELTTWDNIQLNWATGTGTVAVDAVNTPDEVNGTGTLFTSEPGEGNLVRFFTNGQYYYSAINSRVTDTFMYLYRDMPVSVLPGTSYEYASTLIEELKDASATTIASAKPLQEPASQQGALLTIADEINNIVSPPYMQGNFFGPLYLRNDSIYIDQPLTIFIAAYTGFIFFDGVVLGTTDGNPMSIDASEKLLQSDMGTLVETNTRTHSEAGIWKFEFNGDNSTVSLNGGYARPFSPGTNPLDVLTVFADVNAANDNDFAVIEIRLYDKLLSEQETTAVVDGLAKRIGVTARSTGNPAACKNLQQWFDAVWVQSSFILDADDNEVASCLGSVFDNSASPSASKPTLVTSPTLYNYGVWNFASASSQYFQQIGSPVTNYMHDGTGGTIVVVARQNSGTSGNRYMASTGDGSSGNTGFGLFIRNADGTIRFRVRNTGSQILFLTPDMPVADDTWFIVQAEFSSTIGRLFVNGTLLDSATPSGAASGSDSTHNLSIAAKGTSESWNGQIAEVLCFTTMMSEDEEQQAILNRYLNLKYPSLLD